MNTKRNWTIIKKSERKKIEDAKTKDKKVKKKKGLL